MRRISSTIVSGACAAVILISPLSHSAFAQAVGRPAAPPAAAAAQGPLGAIGELMKGLNIGPLMMSFGGAGGQTIDFTRSNERNLLKRSDVRSELFIDSKQREQLADLEVQGTKEMQQMVMESVMKNFANNSDLTSIGQSGGAPDLSKLKDTLNASFQGMQESLQTFQAAQDTKGEVLLKPKQIKRLHELDLQWRGLLSLSEKKVADTLKATPEQRATVDEALKDYMDTQMKLIQPIMMQAANIGAQAATNGGAPPAGFNPQGMQKQMMDVMEGDDMKKARAAAEAKVKASLTAEQKSQWTQMLGQKFQFLRLDK